MNIRQSRAFDLFEKLKSEGENAIDELISLRQSEQLFLDFKLSSDAGEGKTLSQSDRNNFSKAISGFGNSEGGVIIWGIDCRSNGNDGDLPSEKKPLQDVKKFISLLEGASSGLTLPPHAKIEHYAIETNNSKQGFVISYIAQNNTAPLQDISKKHFYIRAGSNFEPAPYQVLAGMFGKRPQPEINNRYTIAAAELIDNKIKLQVGFMLRNVGKGIAKHTYINVTALSSPGNNSSIKFETTDKTNWSGGFTLGRFLNLISSRDVLLPPEAFVQPVVCHIILEPPFESDLKIEIGCGCEDSIPFKGYLFSKPENIQKIYDKAFRFEGMTWDQDHLHQFATDILGNKLPTE